MMLKYQFKLSLACIQGQKSEWPNYFKNTFDKTCGFLQLCHFSSRTKIEHVGIFEQSRQDTSYAIGQTFIHRVFAYRGVILHAWNAHVYEKNHNPSTLKEVRKKQQATGQTIPKTETYYQVLVDSRDGLNNSAKCVVSYLKNPSQENFPIENIRNMDYISHDDVIPYTSVEDIPICHDLFDKFLVLKKNQMLQGTKTLHRWQEHNRIWLEMCNVYIKTTNNIRVTAIPFYLGVKSLAQPPVYWWRYSIRIENLSGETVQLCKRHWRIISDGSVTRQPGRGVVGKEPILSQQHPAFQYSSQVPLWSPTGHMWGTYLFEKEGGEQFEVCIPAFALESKVDSNFDPNGHKSGTL